MSEQSRDPGRLNPNEPNREKPDPSSRGSNPPGRQDPMKESSTWRGEPAKQNQGQFSEGKGTHNPSGQPGSSGQRSAGAGADRSSSQRGGQPSSPGRQDVPLSGGKPASGIEKLEDEEE